MKIHVILLLSQHIKDYFAINAYISFDTSSAGEVFQNTIQQVLSGIKGCRNISDDIIIYGPTVDECRS